MAKKSYDAVERQLTSLMAQKQAMEQRTVKALLDAIMRTDARAKLVKMSNADLQAVGRLFVENLDNYIGQIDAKKQPKATPDKASDVPDVPADSIKDGTVPDGRPIGTDAVKNPSKKLYPPGSFIA